MFTFVRVHFKLSRPVIARLTRNPPTTTELRVVARHDGVGRGRRRWHRRRCLKSVLARR